MRNRTFWFAFTIIAALLFFAEIDISAQQTNPENIKTDESQQSGTPKIEFVGLDVLPESYIYRAFRENHIKFDNNEESEKAVTVLKELLESKGYPDAVVSSSEQQNANKIRIITFLVKMGEKARVSGIQFINNKHFTNEELTEKLKSCMGDDWNTFRRNYYEYCLGKSVLPFAQSKGYLRARIGELETPRYSAGLIIIIPIDEKIRYRVGNVKVEGAEVFTPQEIIETLGLKSGEVLNGKALRESLYEKGLKELYEEKGYIQYDAEVNPEYIEPKETEQDGKVDYFIIIDEGRRFKIREVEFVGVDKSTGRDLIQSLSIKSGQIFNRKEFRNGLKKVNETEQFAPIDEDRDVEIRIDEEMGEIDLIINVRKN